MSADAFDTTARNMAFQPALAADLASLVAAYGSDATDNAPDGGTFPVIFARWDDEAHTRIRAASHATEAPTALTDGRLAIEGALFTKSLLAALAAGSVPAAAELTDAQLDALRPPTI